MRSAYFRFSITVISSEHLVIAKLEGWPDIKMRWANTIYLIVRFPFRLRWCPEYNLLISFNLEITNWYRLTTFWLDSEHILLYFGGKDCEFSDCPSLAGWLVMLIRKSRTWLMLLKRCHQSILCDMIITSGITAVIKVIHFGNLLLSLPSVSPQNHACSSNITTPAWQSFCFLMMFRNQLPLNLNPGVSPSNPRSAARPQDGHAQVRKFPLITKTAWDLIQEMISSCISTMLPKTYHFISLCSSPQEFSSLRKKSPPR